MRALLDLSAVPELGFAPRRTPDGAAVNAFSVALENHARAPVAVYLALAAPGAQATLRPAEVALAGGERRQVRVVASVRGLAVGRAQAVLGAVARAGAEVIARAQEPVPFVVPGGDP
jgi:hypothetical protein